VTTIHLWLSYLIPDISSICSRTFQTLTIEFGLIPTRSETNICDVSSLFGTDRGLFDPLNV